MRAHFSEALLDNTGNLVSTSTSVRVLMPGTTTLISDLLYADASSGTTLSNPFVIANGKLSFYLADPQRVRLGVTVTGSPEEFFDDLDVLAVGTDSTHPGSGANSTQVGTTSSATGDMTVAVGVGSSATVGHSVAVGHQAAATQDQALALGEQAAASEAGAIALGAASQSSGTQSSALGTAAAATHDGSTAVGTGAQTTVPGQVVLGTASNLVEVPGALVITSADGSRFQVVVSDTGVLTTTLLPPVGS